MSDYQDKHIATRSAYCQRLELGEGKLAEHTTGERSMINFGFAGKAVEEGAYRLQRSYAPLNDENCNKITTFQEDVLGRSDVLWDFYRCVMQNYGRMASGRKRSSRIARLLRRTKRIYVEDINHRLSAHFELICPNFSRILWHA
jgi:hypothetical protein